jgi:hypothetical protein
MAKRNNLGLRYGLVSDAGEEGTNHHNIKVKHGPEKASNPDLQVQQLQSRLSF